MSKPGDYERMRSELVEASELEAGRKWPRKLYDDYLGWQSS